MAKKTTTAGKTATQTELVCPVCGAKFAIADHEHAAHGIVLGKDSGLGTIYMPLDKPGKNSKVNDRMQQLADKGIDTSAFFSMQINGKEELVKQNGAGISVVNAEVFEQILNQGTLRGKHLFKQHVMAQMFKHLTCRYYCGETMGLVRDRSGYYDLSNFTAHMVARGYEDTWKVTVGMLERQAAMYKNNDTKCLREDLRWYNKDLVLEMLDDYVNQLRSIFDNARRRKCRRKEYVRFVHAGRLIGCASYKGVFAEDIHKIFDRLIEWRKDIKYAKNPIELYDVVRRFNYVRPVLHLKKSEFKWDKDEKNFKVVEVRQCKAWQDAYKGYGAYFTMQNMILFHNCYFWTTGTTHHTTDASIVRLNNLAKDHTGYEMLGILKEFLRLNNFDIAAKQAEWRAKYRR